MSVEDLRVEALGTTVVGREVRVFEEIDSTNTYVLDHGFEGLVAVADRQTLGRGRHGRTWYSAPGLGLWFTAGLTGSPKGLVFAAALAVRDAVAPELTLTIKWPNDLLHAGKKVCGILIEQRGSIIALGIGLNVNHLPGDYPDELRDRAGSLRIASGNAWNRGDLLRRLLIQLDQKVMILRGGGYETLRNEWANACGLVGRRIRADAHTGLVEAIDDTGAILLRTAGDLVPVISGEITILGGDESCC